MKTKPEKFTREWFVEQGRKGGQKTKEMHGLKHFSKIREVDNQTKGQKTPAK